MDKDEAIQILRGVQDDLSGPSAANLAIEAAIRALKEEATAEPARELTAISLTLQIITRDHTAAMQVVVPLDTPSSYTPDYGMNVMVIVHPLYSTVKASEAKPEDDSEDDGE